MSRIVITDSGQFESVILSLENSYRKIQDLFANQKKNVEEINATETWTGNSQKVLYEKYKLLNSNYEPIEYSIELYIKFLRKTLEDYTLAEQEINRDIDEMASNLDVNS